MPTKLHTAAQGAKTFNPGPRQGGSWLSRWAVPCTIGVAVLSAYAVGAHWLVQASERQTRLPETDADVQPLEVLRPWMAGEAIETPVGAGIWPARWAGAEGVIVRAQNDGPVQRIPLCMQANPQPGDAGNLYPMALTASLDAATSGLSTATLGRNPLVLSAAAGAGLPKVWLEGSMGTATSPARLVLRVASPTTPNASAASSAATSDAPAWQVMMASAINPPGKAGASRFSFDKEAWLLWRPLPTAANVISATAFAQAVRIRLLPDAGCAAGSIEWRLYSTSGPVASEVTPPAMAWLRPTPPHGGGVDASRAVEPTVRVRLPEGRVQVPGALAATMEDHELFDRAVRHGLIVPRVDQRLAIVPADAARMPAAASSGATTGLTPEAELVLKALHQSANGDFVRAQVAESNRSRYWLAVRLMATEATNLPVVPQATHWKASAGQELLEMTEGLPGVSARLFRSMPATAFPWVRVLAPQAWTNPTLQAQARPDDEPVRLTLPAQQAPAGARFAVLVLGSVVGVDGAQIESTRPACAGPGCAHEQDMTRLELRRDPAATNVVLHLRPQPNFNDLAPAGSERLAVQWRAGRPVWMDSPARSARAFKPADVQLLAADGTVLFAGDAPSTAARTSGLLPLVGLGKAHAGGLGGMLSLLGQEGHPQVVARTSLELRYQQPLNDILQCVAHQGGQWQADAGRCELPSGATNVDDRRMAYAVVLDAGTGDILAATNGSPLPEQVSAEDLVAFDAFNPAASLLRVGAWQQVGGVTQSPGSTFKVVDALTFEALARQSPAVELALAGQTVEQLNGMTRAHGMSFDVSSACYPAPCNSAVAKVRNFGDAPTTRYLRNGKLGLQEALSKSSNTWFGMMGEYVDATVRTGHADARPLGNGALRSQRPVLSMLDQLSFFEAARLDGGLLPAEYHWRSGDVLQASASALDPLETVHSVRQQALGLRMQTTPLQMARVAAAVATGRVPNPRLLLALNERTAVAAPSLVLAAGTPRLQHAMNSVVTEGTAHGAFDAPALKDVRTRLAFIHGKTGSAPMASRDDDLHCGRLPSSAAMPLACMHNAWFIGYLQPGALPGEQRTLAFAVQVTHTRETGGKQAAPVVSQWMQSVWTQFNASGKAVAGPVVTAVSKG